MNTLKFTEFIIELYQWLTTVQAASATLKDAEFKAKKAAESAADEVAKYEATLENHRKVFELHWPSERAVIEKARSEHPKQFNKMLKSFPKTPWNEHYKATDPEPEERVIVWEGAPSFNPEMWTARHKDGETVWIPKKLTKPTAEEPKSK